MTHTRKINLDIGCGSNKHKGCIGMDSRNIDGVDVVHDLELFPYPFDDESCKVILASHILEHIKPWLSVCLMDELWRIMVPHGSLAVSVPYPGTEEYWQDPTHCNGWNEKTFEYFDPDCVLYFQYKPKPWKIAKGYPDRLDNNLTALLTKRKL